MVITNLTYGVCMIKMATCSRNKLLTEPITGAGFDNKTGVTTEQVDTDHDGKPDLERKYDREGRKTGEQPIKPGSAGTTSTNTITGVTTEWVDTNNDSHPDIVRKKAKDGTLIGEFPLDEGAIVLDSVTDPRTGSETKYVDKNADGIPEAARMYDKFGNKITDRIIRGKLIKRDLDETTGELTEWIDMDGDGRPDIYRKFNVNGKQIDENNVKPGDLGNAVGMSFDHSTGNSTIFVDENEDYEPEYVLICDPTGILLAQNDFDPVSSPDLLPIVNKWPRLSSKLTQGYESSQNTPDPTNPPPTVESAAPASSDSEQACTVFEDIEIENLVVRHMRDCKPTLNFHYMMDVAIPGLVSESPINLDYTATVNGKQGTCFIEEGYDDRLYCRIDISANEAYTLGHFELFANPCQEPISVLDQTLPMLEGCDEHQTAPEENQTEFEETEEDS